MNPSPGKTLTLRLPGWPAPGGLSIQRTVSIGYAWRQADEGHEDTLRRADNALLDAKRGGRDRRVLAA